MHMVVGCVLSPVAFVSGAVVVKELMPEQYLDALECASMLEA